MALHELANQLEQLFMLPCNKHRLAVIFILHKLGGQWRKLCYTIAGIHRHTQLNGGRLNRRQGADIVVRYALVDILLARVWRINCRGLAKLADQDLG